jgi:uncharacterized protein YoxC
MADLQDSLQKLDRLTQEEARMALAEVLKITHCVRDEVKVVDGRVESVGDKVEDVVGRVDDVSDKVDDVGDKVDDVGDKVEVISDKVDDIDDKVQRVEEKVQVVIDGERGLFSQSVTPSKIYNFRRQESKGRVEENRIDCSTDRDWHRRSQVFVIP